MMSIAWLGVTAIFASFCATWLVRRYAVSKNVVDVPNDRSSHRVTTARGGGLAIVLTFFGVLIVLKSMNVVSLPLLVAILGGGGLVALVGFLDDHRHVSALWRLLTHFVSAGWAVYWLGVTPSISIGTIAIAAPVVVLLAVVCMVWLVNLYNFMDGIDGIASIEAITVCFGAALLIYLGQPSAMYWAPPLLFGASVLGFLFWNYPPARIFMGDIGSGFLGYVLAVFCLQSVWIAEEMIWAWAILLGAFIVDTTLTLFRRMLRGHRPHTAHRCHAYQHASRRFSKHKPVSVALGVINLVWLLPIAALVVFGILDGIVGLLIAYAPLIVLALEFGSGTDELRST